jgi:hypothetical protein
VELGCSADKTERECRFENKKVEINKIIPCPRRFRSFLICTLVFIKSRLEPVFLSSVQQVSSSASAKELYSSQPRPPFVSLPLSLLNLLLPMAQSTTSADRPERSRNAKAQARHRAKRKAYIEQVSHLGQCPQLGLSLTEPVIFYL